MQLDEGEKGFSFAKEGPLDMRMDQSVGITAAEVVNRWPEKKLGETFRDYGEERSWRKAAKAICEERKKRKFKTTKQLADFLSATLGRKRNKLHPATLIFQALRICVNDELKAIEEGISKAIKFLSGGGKMGVISFHSLEDRIVKNILRQAASKKDKTPVIRLLNKKPLVASQAEIRKNRRSRSAKMRCAQKVGETE